ncbi:Bcr/CflA family drug resistance efflux transporter [Roseibium aquae]|uniref:Bcr/CflA family efflux transporter n=1 Tax=Roseibium aquae TaxID=1323746 RepID=A0A916TAQ6_9HYPH|nr:multidrug effflux MFS transporter [Roseibium aquae]GGB38258.1 Bcr/CflA family drug resistance efflux transporter [Roseibium aquae]
MNADHPVMSARRTSLLGAGLVAIGPVSMALYTPAMPALAEAFGTTDSVIKLTLTAYFVGFAVTQLICGPLTDAFGRKPVTLAFLSLYLLSSVMATFAPDITWMLIARTLQGVGAAVGIAVSRAIVRDQFTGQNSARIMNTIAMMLALGPAISPTIGGFVLEFFGWREVFWCMIVYGVVLMAAVALYQRESNAFKGRHHLNPRQLGINYATLLRDRRFLAPSLLVGFSLGNLYALTTVLPFILIYEVGLSPSQFGLTMMLQSGSFICGTIVTGRVLKRTDAIHLLPYGMAGLVAASSAMVGSMVLLSPTLLSVMVPVMMFAFSLAFVLPASFTQAMQGFPQIAGAASSVMGFLQFGGGIVGSLIVAALGDPLLGMATVIAGMPVAGVAAYLLLTRGAKKTEAQPAE